MKKNEFRTPLIQSGALLVAIVFIISLIPSGDGMSVGSVIGAFFSGIFHVILLVLALSIAITVSIAVLVGIFIASVALQSPEKASEIYSETKIRLTELIQDTLKKKSLNTEAADTGINLEDYDQMNSELSSLQNKNLKLHNDVSVLHTKNAQLQEDIHGLTTMVDQLKESEENINNLISELSAKVKEDPDTELKAQIQKLEEMYSKTNENFSDLAGRLESLEDAATEPQVETQLGGIFSYIENDDDQVLFTKMVEEGIVKDLTYAQFDGFLTESLPAELDKIIKDHPSLTKDYIRSMRK